VRVYRLLVEVEPRVWTLVVAAPDVVEAWTLVTRGFARADRERASLEEVEALGARAATGTPRVLRQWLSAGPPTPALVWRAGLEAA
jgi:hypothetical protein